MAGKIQNEDIKSAADLVAAGGTAAQLPNDTKIYMTANGINDTLYNAVLAGKIGSGGGGSFNYISNGNFETGATTGWATYNNAQTVTITIATPAVFTVTSTTGMYVGQPHHFTTTGALPTGLTAGTTYYISSVVSGTTFQVSATPGGTSVATSGTQSGTHTDRPMVPLTGTGGTANVTWTTTTTSPLRNTTSALFTKDANDRAGEGVAYAFTTALEDSAKVLQVTIPYIVNSGTFAAGSPTTDSDVEAWIYDVTNATLIQISTYKLFSNSSTVPSALIGNFQTASNSTSYRLILHVATSSASAYVLKFDDISVSPTQYALGSIITDWVERGPLVITAQTTAPGKGTVAFDGFLTRRVGGALEYIYTFNQTTAGTAGSGIYFFNMPSGLPIDTSKIQLATASTTSVQPGTILGNGKTGIVGTEGDWAMFQAFSSTQLIMTTNSSGSSSVLQVSSTWNALNVANKFYTVAGSIPILGWAVQQQTSDINDQRIVAARYYDNTGSAISTTQPMNYSVKDIDTHSAVTTGSAWKFTAPIAGIYSVSVTGQVSGTAGTCSIYKNGTATTQVLFEIENPNIIAGTQLISLNAGDYIDIRSSGSSNATTSPTGVNAISIMRVANPAQLSTTETVAASYWISASQTASTSAPINYDQKEFDTHGAVTTGSAWKFTAPIRALYQIDISFSSSTASINVWSLYKNGTGYKNLTLTSSTFATGNASTSVYLNAGDYIDIRPGTSMAMTTSATLFTTANDVNVINIKKIGI